MRVLIGCVLLFILPTTAIVVYKQFRDFQALEAQLREEAAQGATGRGEVLFFNASWCGPCRQMKPIVTDMRRQGYRLRDVDIDKNRPLAAKYKINSLPTFVFLENGAEVKRFSGGTSSERLHKLCSNPVYR